MSTASQDELAAWRVFFECASALIDVLNVELQAERGMTLRWYDVLVHLEKNEDGMPMSELAGRILFSKSGLTRVIDQMESAGLVRRERPPGDRRVVRVLITPGGRDTLRAARAVHHRGIQEHFLQHVEQGELTVLAHVLENVRDHVRPLRPGRLSR